MVKWTSGGSERTFNQSAANGRNEPILTNAARRTNDGFDQWQKTTRFIAWICVKKSNVLRSPTEIGHSLDQSDPRIAAKSS